MSDFKVRLQAEIEDLTEKVDKLRNFIGSDVYLQLQVEDQNLLDDQVGFMGDYLSVLEKRAARLL